MPEPNARAEVHVSQHAWQGSPLKIVLDVPGFDAPMAPHAPTGSDARGADIARPALAARELAGHPAVDRARAAQHLVRTIDYQPERFAVMRDEAVHAALGDGVAAQRIAEELDVRPEDVHLMSNHHVARSGSSSGRRTGS